MQPERISGQPYSIRSDVWSAGLTLLELVTNKFPFPHEIGPIDLIFYITQSDVSKHFIFSLAHSHIFTRSRSRKPPSLEDEEDIKWSDKMKHFIKVTCVYLIFLIQSVDAHRLMNSFRLTVSATERPTPKEMLDHPWIVENMKREVKMATWIRQVWGWKRQDGYSVRFEPSFKSRLP